MIIKAGTWQALTSGERMSALSYLHEQTQCKWERRAV